jgi:hypothetical protein
MFSPRLVAKTYTQTLPACGSLPSLAGEFMAKREPTGGSNLCNAALANLSIGEKPST